MCKKHNATVAYQASLVKSRAEHLIAAQMRGSLFLSCLIILNLNFFKEGKMVFTITKK
jgi:hypothetical protein